MGWPGEVATNSPQTPETQRAPLTLSQNLAAKGWMGDAHLDVCPPHTHRLWGPNLDKDASQSCCLCVYLSELLKRRRVTTVLSTTHRWKECRGKPSGDQEEMRRHSPGRWRDCRLPYWPWVLDLAPPRQEWSPRKETGHNQPSACSKTQLCAQLREASSGFISVVATTWCGKKCCHIHMEGFL